MYTHAVLGIQPPLKPTTLSTLLSAAVLFLNKSRAVPDPPQKLGERYTIVRRIPNTNGFPKYGIGLYEDECQRYIVKTWRGKFKDLNYYALANEYRVNAILDHKIDDLGFGDLVRVPKIHGYFSHTHSLSIILEYVDGDSLQSLPDAEKTHYLHQLLQALQSISQHLTPAERQQFARRSAWFYCATLPALALLFSKHYPTYVHHALRWGSACMRDLVGWRSVNLTLAHRDLVPENVIVREGIPYLIDSERMVLTLPFYDLAYMSVHPETSSIAENHEQWRKAAASPMRPYVLMHAAVDLTHSTHQDRSTGLLRRAGLRERR
jgi:hypothetical protein